MTLHSRRVDWKRLTVAQRMEAEQLIRLSAEVEDELGIARYETLGLHRRCYRSPMAEAEQGKESYEVLNPAAAK